MELLTLILLFCAAREPVCFIEIERCTLMQAEAVPKLTDEELFQKCAIEQVKE